MAQLSWEAAKRTTYNQVQSLPEYTDADILAGYRSLLDELEKEEVKAMKPAVRAFAMQRQFPQFALAYSGLFNLACRRQAPLPIAVVEEMLQVAKMQKAGKIDEAKARGLSMDLAEAYRRSTSSVSAQPQLK